jgi:hypothetical protein
MDLTVAAHVCAPHADARAIDQEPVDTIKAGFQLRVVVSESLTVPKVDASLVSNLDGCVDIGTRGSHEADNPILGLGGQIAIFEVKHVIVADVLCRRTPRLQVPYRLEQASGD